MYAIKEAVMTERDVIVTKVETVTDVNEVITLVLNRDEADFLRDLTWRIGGCPDHSRRGHADALSNALADAGVTGTDRMDISNKSGISFDDVITPD